MYKQITFGIVFKINHYLQVKRKQTELNYIQHINHTL